MDKNQFAHIGTSLEQTLLFQHATSAANYPGDGVIQKLIQKKHLAPGKIPYIEL